jgi:hypothetical protein
MHPSETQQGTDMRSFDGQRSDGAPIRRSREEKEKQLQELLEKRKHLGMHTSATLRAAMDRKIDELKTELALADRAAAMQATSPGSRGPRDGARAPREGARAPREAGGFRRQS